MRPRSLTSSFEAAMVEDALLAAAEAPEAEHIWTSPFSKPLASFALVDLDLGFSRSPGAASTTAEAGFSYFSHPSVLTVLFPVDRRGEMGPMDECAIVSPAMQSQLYELLSDGAETLGV